MLIFRCDKCGRERQLKMSDTRELQRQQDGSYIFIHKTLDSIKPICPYCEAYKSRKEPEEKVGE